MKRKHISKTLLSLLLVAAMLTLSGCGGAEDLTKDITPNQVSTSQISDAENATATDFALQVRMRVKTLCSRPSRCFLRWR